MDNPAQFQIDATQQERSFQTDDGAAGGFALGRQVHPQARLELEFGYRQNDFDSFRIEEYTDSLISTDPNADPSGIQALTNITTEAAVGELQSYTIMGNFLYDFSPRFLHRYNLYGGGGIGAINVSGTATTATDVFDVNDSTFAYQIIFGCNRSITQRIDLFLDYRFMSASSISVTNASNGASLGSFELNTNSVFLGMRVRK
jgi:opacity protein-like surface antigen